MTYSFINDCDKDEKKDSNGTDSFIEKKLLEERKIIISGGVDSQLAEKTIKTLFLLDAIDHEKPIR